MLSRVKILLCCLPLCAWGGLALADDSAPADASDPTYAANTADVVYAYDADDPAAAGVGTAKVPMGYTSKDPWLDRTQRWVFQSVWRSAIRIDRVFGAEIDDS